MLDALPPGVLQLGHEVDRARRSRRPGLAAPSPTGRRPRPTCVVGADGIDSFVRRALWGEQPIRQQRLHLVGGYLFLDGPPPNDTVVMHNRTDAGQLLGDPPRGQVGLRVVGARGLRPEQAVRRRTCTSSRDRAPRRFADPLPVAGRADAARAPAALGDPRPQAAQAVVQGPGDARRRRRPPHLPLRRLRRRHVDRGRLLPRLRARAGRPARHAPRSGRALQAFEERRKPHTQAGDRAGVLHRLRLPPRCPRPLRPLRDLVYDHTPLLQKVIGDDTPKHILSQLAEIDEAERRRPVPVAS